MDRQGIFRANASGRNEKVREASELKNVTKSGKSPIGGKKSKSPKFEIWTF